MITAEDIAIVIDRCGLDTETADELLTILNDPRIVVYSDIFIDNSRLLYNFHHEKYQPVITKQTIPSGTVYSIEPPCGSTTYLIETPNLLVVIDSGFTCYAEELKSTLSSLVCDFETREKVLILTHSDVDHVGLLDGFSRIYLSRFTLEDLQKRAQNIPTVREEFEERRLFYRALGILGKSEVTNRENMQVISDFAPDAKEPLNYSRNLSLGTLDFEVYETSGGHIPGSLILIERNNRLVFSGDTYVNPDMRTLQKSFITISYSRVPSTNTDSVKAKAERMKMFELLGDEKWIICGGHGALMNYPVQK